MRLLAAPSPQCLVYFERAESGDATAQFQTGLCYAWGEGVKQDYDEAARWVRKAAEHGNVHAQRALGPLYGEGYGVPADYVEAFKLYARALDRGDVSLHAPPAQMSRRFARWYRTAADQGDADAQRALGILYANGLGVLQDYEEGYFWLSLSIEKTGWNPERDSNSWARDRRREIASHLTPQQQDCVRKRIADWKPVSAP